MDVTIYLSAVSERVYICGLQVVRLKGFLYLHSLIYYCLSKRHSNRHVHCVWRSGTRLTAVNVVSGKGGVCVAPNSVHKLGPLCVIWDRASRTYGKGPSLTVLHINNPGKRHDQGVQQIHTFPSPSSNAFGHTVDKIRRSCSILVHIIVLCSYNYIVWAELGFH